MKNKTVTLATHYQANKKTTALAFNSPGERPPSLDSTTPWVGLKAIFDPASSIVGKVSLAKKRRIV
jgi:hypothetical protein